MRQEISTHLDEPRPLPEAMETQLVRDFSSVHSVGKILLVGEDKQESVAELVLVEHPLELLTSLRNTFPIVGVDNEDDALRVLEVCGRVRERDAGARAEAELESADTSDAGGTTRTMPPERTDLVLSSDVPDGEGDVLVLYRLDVETWRWQARHCQRARTRAVRRLIPTDGRDSRDNFTELELVQDGGLTSGIETDLK